MQTTSVQHGLSRIDLNLNLRSRSKSMRLRSTSTMAHPHWPKLSTTVSLWIYNISQRKNMIIKERNERYTMTSFLCLEVNFLALTSTFENRFSSLLSSKPPFQPEMSRPRNVSTTAIFKVSVLLFIGITMQKEALKKKCFSLRNRIAKFDNAIPEV